MLIESTGVIGHRIKKVSIECISSSFPLLLRLLGQRILECNSWMMKDLRYNFWVMKDLKCNLLDEGF